MKVVILTGGLGTRLQEYTTIIPKPMVEIGGKPILWHIMKSYDFYGFQEFVLAMGYKSEVIKDYFYNYYYRINNMSINLKKGTTDFHDNQSENWLVHLLDTGLLTQTGGRIKRSAEFIGDETFMLTYGDGVANINIRDLLNFHKKEGKIATVTAVRPPARFGGLTFEGNRVVRFQEKPQLGEGWINGGFFVLEPEIKEYIKNDETIFEKEPLERLAEEGELVAYRHDNFWQCMDTIRDVHVLNSMWEQNKSPWKVGE
jgi:glucose-1-phosphate cytidylyltransferase